MKIGLIIVIVVMVLIIIGIFYFARKEIEKNNGYRKWL